MEEGPCWLPEPFQLGRGLFAGFVQVAIQIHDQPENGFTVAANESEEQIQMLCRTYESGDAESRRMTRMIAELSVTR